MTFRRGALLSQGVSSLSTAASLTSPSSLPGGGGGLGARGLLSRPGASKVGGAPILPLP